MRYKNVSHLSMEELDHLKRCGLLWSRLRHRSSGDWPEWEIEDEDYEDWSVWATTYNLEYQKNFNRIKWTHKEIYEDIGYIQAAILVETEE